MKIVASVLIVSLAIVFFLPGRVWAPPQSHFFFGEVVRVSVDDAPTYEDPWSRVRVKASLWGITNENGNPNSDVNGNGGDIRF